MIECNHDCLHCPYPEMPEECEDAPLTYDEYKQQSWVERHLFAEVERTHRQKVNARAAEKYRNKHKEEIKERQKKWHEQHPERKKQYKQKRDKERDRAYWHAVKHIRKQKLAENQEKFGPIQKKIKIARKKMGIKQRELADMVGVNESTISAWERGVNPANWELLYKAIPNLKDMMESETDSCHVKRTRKQKLCENRVKYGPTQKLIKIAREQSGLKQRELAEMIGVNERTISAWERGTNPAKWELLYKALPDLRQMIEEFNASLETEKQD